MYDKSYLAQRNQNTVRNIGTMADPVVVAERAATVVDYTNFDEHTYRFSSTSKKENESRYLCNKYRVAGETALWGTCRQSMNGRGTTPGERCPGTLIVKHEFGMSGHHLPKT
jgi:hypothetical protein